MESTKVKIEQPVIQINVEGGVRGFQGKQGETGPKGDPFRYEDFTPEQLETLRGPQGPQGKQGEQGIQGIQGVQGIQGKPFSIAKTYTSKEEMENDFDNMTAGDYVMLQTSVEEEDNAKLYYKNETDITWIFVADFSGATGIQGPQGPQGVQGPEGKPGAVQYIAGEGIEITPENVINVLVGSSGIPVLEGTEDNPVNLINFEELGVFLVKGYVYITNPNIKAKWNDGRFFVVQSSMLGAGQLLRYYFDYNGGMYIYYNTKTIGTDTTYWQSLKLVINTTLSNYTNTGELVSAGAIRNYFGKPSDCATTAKGTLVAAINELKTNQDSFVSGADNLSYENNVLQLKQGDTLLGDSINFGSSLTNLFYPVGSYYETSDTTFDPNTSWGGTWELEEDGTVLVSASSTRGSAFEEEVGTIVGEETHTMTIEEMPEHIINTTKNVSGGAYDGHFMQGSYEITNTHNIGGNGKAFNIVQPSKIANRWHRTA